MEHRALASALKIERRDKDKSGTDGGDWEKTRKVKGWRMKTAGEVFFSNCVPSSVVDTASLGMISEA